MGKRLGTLIRSARTDAGLTQVQLAQRVPGATASDIGRYERGEAEPSTQVVKDIAKACGVTQKSLLEAMPGASSSSSSSSSATTSMRLTATERRLVELYRNAPSETKKKAMKVLKGESTLDVDNIISAVGGIIGDSLKK
jgi:transcriptional regulator with XRE-family HTH domain